MKPVARLGDLHVCPMHGTNTIVSGGTNIADGRPVARLGDKCSCGATITQGSRYAKDGNRAIAFKGCSSSHGGVITSGSPTASVMP